MPPLPILSSNFSRQREASGKTLARFGGYSQRDESIASFSNLGVLVDSFFRSARHASENLNFRDAVHHYQALCCQAVRAVLAGTANTGLQGERNGATCFVEAAEVAARSIVDRFIKQGAPEQVSLRAIYTRDGAGSRLPLWGETLPTRLL